MTGLSPRVRGNLSGWEALPERGWSIPACTGEPLRFSDFSKNVEQDEPRLDAFYEKNPIGGHYLFRGFAKGLDAEIAQSLRVTLN